MGTTPVWGRSPEAAVSRPRDAQTFGACPRVESGLKNETQDSRALEPASSRSLAAPRVVPQPGKEGLEGQPIASLSKPATRPALGRSRKTGRGGVPATVPARRPLDSGSQLLSVDHIAGPPPCRRADPRVAALGTIDNVDQAWRTARKTGSRRRSCCAGPCPCRQH